MTKIVRGKMRNSDESNDKQPAKDLSGRQKVSKTGLEKDSTVKRHDGDDASVVRKRRPQAAREL
jgi:hypothetical protein